MRCTTACLWYTADLAKETVEIFGELFAAKFPIERMQPYEDFAVGKYAADNDTVGFYCRPAQDNPKVFSSHAYGISVDINSMTNPYHDPKGWWPAGSNGDRNRSAPGLLTAESEAVKIFMRHGWIWGGLLDPPDYMHFGKITLAKKTIPCSDLYGQANCNLRPNDPFIAGHLMSRNKTNGIAALSIGRAKACNGVIF